MTAAAFAVPVAVSLVALHLFLRARRTRAQTVIAVGLVAELTGAVPVGTTERAAALAHSVARRLGVDADAAATAARLCAVEPGVITESGISVPIAQLVREAANAPSGQAQGAAAVARVAHGFARRLGDGRSQASGALFRTVVDHPIGDERRAAEALVHLVQGSAASV